MFKDYFLSLILSVCLMSVLVGVVQRFARHPTVLGLLVLIVRTRFSVLSGLVLVGLPVLAWAEPGMVRAVFVLRNPYQFVSLTWATLMVSLMVIVTFRVTYLTGPARFGELSNARIPEFWGAMRNTNWLHSWWLWLGMGLAIPVYALDQSLAERPSEHSIYLLPLGLVVGILVAIGFLFMLAALQRLLIDPSITNHGLLPFENLHWIKSLNRETDRPPSNLEAKMARTFGPKVIVNMETEERTPEQEYVASSSPAPAPSSTGYIRLPDARNPDQWELEPGHAQIALVWIVLTCLYIGLYGAFLGAIGDGSVDDWLPHQNGIFPTLFFIMIYVFYVGFTLTGAAFFLDYYRIPSTVGLMGLVLISFSLGRVDHFYELHPEPLVPPSTLATSTPQQVPLGDLFDEEWKFPRYAAGGTSPKSTLVVVTAAGGGIQAAAWTTRVLTGLDELFGGFSESIGLVSSVSGGSVGVMFYLHHRGDRTNDPDAPLRIDPQMIKAINEDASASGLEPAAWGMAFPDLIRTTFPPAVPKTLDRGLALEFEWQRRLADRIEVDPAGMTDAERTHRLTIKDLRLLDWADKIRQRKMPAVVFNSTLVETGQRLLFSPVVSQVTPTNNSEDSFTLKAAEPVEFFPCFAAATDGFVPNPRLVTAVRLSATFSYVSPICRPLADTLPAAARSRVGKRLYWHVADGGYSDNEGILTATKWIEQVLAQRRSGGRSGKLPFDRVLIIRINGFPDKAVEAGSDRTGLLNAFLGPVLALGSVRVASQAERGDYEVQLLEEATRLRRAQKLHEAGQLLASARDINSQLESNLNTRGGTATTPGVAASPESAPANTQQAIADALEQRIDHLRNSHEDERPEVVKEVESETQKVETKLRQSRDKRREYERAVEVRSIKIQFPADLDRPPLSWALTPSDERLIETAWQQIASSIRQAEQTAQLPDVGTQSLTPKHLRYYFPLRATESAE